MARGLVAAAAVAAAVAVAAAGDSVPVALRQRWAWAGLRHAHPPCPRPISPCQSQPAWVSRPCPPVTAAFKARSHHWQRTRAAPRDPCIRRRTQVCRLVAVVPVPVPVVVVVVCMPVGHLVRL